MRLRDGIPLWVIGALAALALLAAALFGARVEAALTMLKFQPQAVAEVLLDWTDGRQGTRTAQLEEDIEAFVDQYHGTPLAQLHLGEMLTEVTRVLREHKLVLPADLALLIKAFVSLESMGRGLDPGFHMAAEAPPLAPLSAERIRQRIERAAKQVLQ